MTAVCTLHSGKAPEKYIPVSKVTANQGRCQNQGPGIGLCIQSASLTASQWDIDLNRATL